MNSHSPEQNKDILTCLSHWFIHTNRNFSRRERRNFHGNKCSHDVFKCVFLLVSLRYEQARRKFQAVFLSIKQKIMSSDLELEEFNGLGTALAPRIPNAENRNLELKVNIFNLIIEKKRRRSFYSNRSIRNKNVINRHNMTLMKMRLKFICSKII